MTGDGFRWDRWANELYVHPGVDVSGICVGNICARFADNESGRVLVRRVTLDGGRELTSQAALAARCKLDEKTARKGVRQLAAAGLVDVRRGQGGLVIHLLDDSNRDQFPTGTRPDGNRSQREHVLFPSGASPVPNGSASRFQTGAPYLPARKTGKSRVRGAL